MNGKKIKGKNWLSTVQAYVCGSQVYCVVGHLCAICVPNKITIYTTYAFRTDSKPIISTTWEAFDREFLVIVVVVFVVFTQFVLRIIYIILEKINSCVEA